MGDPTGPDAAAAALEQLATVVRTSQGLPDDAPLTLRTAATGPNGVPYHPPMAIALMVSPAEREHIDLIRARSYQLALQRGHIRR